MPVQSNPYVPPAPGPLLMETFAGVNTSTTRMGVPDEMCYWIDGYFPLDQHNLRTLYDVGTTLYTAAGTTIVFFGFVNISATAYMILFQADGSVVAVNVTTAAATTILPAGTITNPNQLNIGLSQWGQQYAIIVANQPNGYWLWDGLVVYQAGSIGPVVTLTNNGSGYVSLPAIGLVGGSGHGAIFTSSISNGSVVSVSIINPGTGYLVGDTPTLTFVGGNQSGSGATITAGLAHSAGGTGGSITVTMINLHNGFGQYAASATLVAGGSGYSPFLKANVTGGNPVPNNGLRIQLFETAGAITSINPAGGTYNSSVAPTVSITDAGFYFISTTTITAPGTGYSNYPVLSVVDVNGSIQSSPVLTASVVNGSISSVSIVSGGQFGASVNPTVVITDVASVAVGTVTLMPFGVSGTTVETYSGHVWVAQANNLNYSAPGSPSNFATSAGGGSFQSTDSYLKIGYTRLIQSNGFLYLIADSSIDYISGVQTAGTPPLTTFTKQNASPTIGTPYPWSVELRGQDLLFANSVGMYVVAGANPVKVSHALDGVWATVPNFNGLLLSSAHAEIYSREVWMTLSTYVNPVTAGTVTQPLMWDGDKKWFTSPQNLNMTFVDSIEINSVFTAYGTDGTVVAPLFNTPSTNFTKTVQSKLWPEPGGYLLNHAVNRFWAMTQYYSIASASITALIDAVSADPSQAGSIVSTSATYTILGPSITGPWLTPPYAVGQQGILMGMTLKTNCADMAWVSAMIDDKIVGYRG